MKRYIFLLVIFILGFTVNDVRKDIITLDWKFIDGNNSIIYNDTSQNLVYTDTETSLPVLSLVFQAERSDRSFRFVLEDPVFEVWNPAVVIPQFETLDENLCTSTNRIKSGNEIRFEFRITPVIKKKDQLFRLTSFALKKIPVVEKNAVAEHHNWKSSSVLKSGKWLRVSTAGKGIYKIPYQTLKDWGFADPAQVRVFGSGGMALSEDPGNIAYDDLPQIAVWHARNNGVDCLFFYEPGTVQWQLDVNGRYFLHSINEYTSKGYFFLTADAGTPKSPEALSPAQGQPTHTITSFDAYDLYEVEKINILPGGSGKQWFGDNFINGTVRSFSLNLPDAADPAVSLKINAAARSSSPSEMPVSVNLTNVGSLEFSSVSTGNSNSIFANEQNKRFGIQLQGDKMDVSVKYFADNSNAEAWFDYAEVNYRRNLKLRDGFLFFRDRNSAGEGKVLEFIVDGATADTRVFDVTNLHQIGEVPLQISDNKAKGKMPSNQLREYVAFSPNGSFPQPELVGEVVNQDLHSMSTPDYLIITHPNFVAAANALADFHRSVDGMHVEVVETPEIYNEFSSGARHATGIRNFIKMLYDRNDGLQYVLLFGDGSYDNKGINKGSSSFIPTYQSVNSLSPTESFVSDDYFVLLDDGENVRNGAVDLGIGRIPAATRYDAELVVNKILSYYSQSALGDWRNMLCFIGDDEDGNEHMSQSEQLAGQVSNNHYEYTIDKIYFDAYMQQATPAGERYPGVTDAINRRVKDGVFILNYVGHANSRFLSDEHVLDVSDINSWSNADKLFIFVTATCEFSRFDADETSAGEYVLLNPSGGGIGLFSTTRLVWSNYNFRLSQSFYDHVLDRDENGQHHRMGDIIRLAKIDTRNTGTNKRNFILLADPALRLSYPRYKVVTTSINGKDVSVDIDTIGALSQVTVTGYIADENDVKISDFNGELVPTVYDKLSKMKTLGNAGANPMEFLTRENIIYKGLTDIANGEFSFSFVVPKDISYNLGEGKIVYYAHNDDTDAHGAYDEFFIGGASGGDITDNQGPEIELFLDTRDFVQGDQTGRNPTLLAFLADENGINTVGTGIGHDITAVIDNDYSNVMVLNNFYQANANDYTGGTVRFPLRNLDVGRHTLRLKAWDIANNSSEAEIEFTVTGEFEIAAVSNYPNPVSDHTFFTFEHNQADMPLKTVFEIYDLNGRRIDYFVMDVGSNENVSNPVRWDLNSASVSVVNGTYLYKITVQNSEGIITSKSGKMMVAR